MSSTKGSWKTSRDYNYDRAANEVRSEHHYAIVDEEVTPECGEPDVTLSFDKFGPLILQPPDSSGTSAADLCLTPRGRLHPPLDTPAGQRDCGRP